MLLSVLFMFLYVVVVFCVVCVLWLCFGVSDFFCFMLRLCVALFVACFVVCSVLCVFGV